MIPLSAVVRKLLAESCQRNEDMDGKTHLSFHTPKGGLFMIPRPLEEEECFTEGQLREIGNQLDASGIDLLPLDRF